MIGFSVELHIYHIVDNAEIEIILNQTTILGLVSELAFRNFFNLTRLRIEL